MRIHDAKFMMRLLTLIKLRFVEQCPGRLRTPLLPHTMPLPGHVAGMATPE